eukprot:jgi/Picsp_1/1213/NSC_04694-R1_26s proteasome regulatory subunit s2
MLLTVIFFPLSLVYVGGLSTSILVLLTFSPALAMYITGDTSTVTINAIDYTVISLATSLVGLYVLLLGVCTLYLRLESYFDSVPWQVKNSTCKDKEDIYKCPFTGLCPTRRCPSCEARVHKNAFVESQKMYSYLGTTCILRWDKAKVAVTRENEAGGRIQLDEALNFAGNITTLSVSSCCIGCAVWQKCFNLGKRLTLSLALSSLFFTYFSWAFESFLAEIGTTGIVLKIASGTLAVLLASMSLLLEIKINLRAFAFLVQYKNEIPIPNFLANIKSESLVNSCLFQGLGSTPFDPIHF